MAHTNSNALEHSAQTSLLKDIAQLFKMRLTTTVVLSALLGYLLGMDAMHWPTFAWLALGGFLLTGGSNGLNQVWERDYDKIMKRTQSRPIPSGRMTPLAGLLISGLSGLFGVLILWIAINPTAGILGLLAITTYVLCYTPLKRVSTWAVAVGAFPGAIPPMLGYVAGCGYFGLEAGLMFAVQFAWQFPHFWAIGWVAGNDYQSAGYKLLPGNGERNKRTAILILWYTIAVLPVSVLPVFLPQTEPMVGNIALAVAVILGAIFIWLAIKLVKSQADKDAKTLMFYSFAYLPLLQIAFVLDKI